MSETNSKPSSTELDVRGMRKPDKHPTIFRTYDELHVDESFILINDHDPKHLREEFETDHAGSYRWEYLNREKRDWRIRITKLASTPIPRVLVDTTSASLEAESADTIGAAWRLQPSERDLDSNIIALPAGQGIDSHAGPDLDVLIHILAGTGTLTTEIGSIDLSPGQLLWLPRRSQRQFTAGPDGLRYLTVHQRRKALVLNTSAPT